MLREMEHGTQVQTARPRTRCRGLNDGKKTGTGLRIVSATAAGGAFKLDYRHQADHYPFQLVGNESEKVK